MEVAERAEGPPIAPALFYGFPFGILLVSSRGSVVDLNERASELLGLAARPAAGSSFSCCDLVCRAAADQVAAGEAECLTRMALDTGTLPEVRVDVRSGEGVVGLWVTASPVDGRRQVLFHLRPGAAGDRRRRVAPQWTPDERSGVQVQTLGETRVAIDERPVGGAWVHQRPGQLLKYLVCERQRFAASDEIADALWPHSGPEAIGRVRQYVHALRAQLEPGRARRAPSRVVVGQSGGYRLAPDRVSIDANDFEDEISAGLTLYVQGESDAAKPRLLRAVGLYSGDFLADDPYAEWALAERDRLRELAGRGLRALVSIELCEDELGDAAVHARRLADMEPLDADVQRVFIEICLRRGRRSEAARRYSLLRKRTRQEFGEQPDFALSDLTD